ncbi:MAG TPA: RNA-binding protein [Spirochaetota bacterium]|nr:RNA-binding protein [Spirochaetota bacterium]HPC41830.1 RNA-binding protein [Spirochaetota bacterium]HPL17679.1 RNA-binding protein [Spirochaetota bacterium]HQF07551.1 RNA-binding protein [Spirochaetota bacterium]HQH96282.1 RNA-binding protein [Spirochaetota bacterium]
MSKQIYAGNLSYQMSDETLRDLFQQHGEVTSVKIIRYPDSGKSKGFGFIEMANDSEADAAIQKLNGSEVQGRNIRVNVARPKKNGE